MRKIGIPLKTPVFLCMGFKEVYHSQICFPNVIKLFSLSNSAEHEFYHVDNVKMPSHGGEVANENCLAMLHCLDPLIVLNS